MTQSDLIVNCPVDCGNAPKKEVLKQFMIAYAKCDFTAMSHYMTDHVEWDLVGDRIITGKACLLEELKSMNIQPAKELTIHQIITHGWIASINGVLHYDKKNFAVCDVVQFNSAAKHGLIKHIQSYVIEL